MEHHDWLSFQSTLHDPDNESYHLNMIFVKLTENMKQMKFKNQKQSDIKSFFRW